MKETDVQRNNSPFRFPCVCVCVCGRKKQRSDTSFVSGSTVNEAAHQHMNSTTNGRPKPVLPSRIRLRFSFALFFCAVIFATTVIAAPAAAAVAAAAVVVVVVISSRNSKQLWSALN